MDTNNNIHFTLGVGNIQDILNQIKQVDNAFKSIGKNATLKDVGGIGSLAKSYGDEIGQLTKQAQELHRVWKATGDQTAKNQFDAIVPSIRKATNEYQSFRKELGLVHNSAYSLGDSFSYLGAKMRSHLSWLVSGSIIGATAGLPIAIANVARETEVLNQKLRQNLELVEKYHNGVSLDGDLKQLNDIAAVYAVGFGANLKDVMNTMVLLSRRFKDVNEISYLTHMALVMNKLDFLDLEKGANSLESVILQFGLSTRETRDFLNQLSVAVHISNINATELMDGLMRSGSSFKQFNMGTAEAIASIGALKSETARSGSVIGNTFKSIAANFAMDKAIKALDSYGIKLYEVNNQGLKTMRQGANIFAELQALFGKLDDEGKQKLALSLAGGKYQVNQMMAFLADANGNFQKILTDIQTKSSDALTASLLKLGLETWQVKLMQLEASLEVFGKTIGDSVLPELKNMTDGLTNGVMWLTQHKEAVGNLVTALIELAKVVLAYKIQQVLANVAVKEGTILLRAFYLLEGDFKTAFYGMTGSLKTFGAAVATLSLQLAALYVGINVVSAMYDRFTDKSGLTGKQQDLQGRLLALEADKQQALARVGVVPGVTKERVEQSYAEQKADLEAQLAEVNSKKQEQQNTAVSKAADESERAFQAMLDRALAQAEKAQATIGNMIPSGKVSKGSHGLTYAPDDHKQEVFKLDKTRDVTDMFAQQKINADAYAASLEKLNTQIQKYGLSVETSMKRQNLMKGHMGDTLGYAMMYESTANDYEQQANDMIASSGELVSQLNNQRVSWAGLSKEEKHTFIEMNKNYIADYKLLNSLLDKADQLRVKAADMKKEASKTGSDVVKASIDDPKTIYDKNMSGYNLHEQLDTAKLGPNTTDQQKKLIELRYSIIELSEARRRLKEIEESPNSTVEELKKQELAIDQLENKIRSLSDVWGEVKTEAVNVLDELLLQGKKGHEVWTTLWKAFGQEALDALTGVPHQQSLIGKIFSGLNYKGPQNETGKANSSLSLTSNVVPNFSNAGNTVIPKKTTDMSAGVSFFSPSVDSTVDADIRKDKNKDSSGESNNYSWLFGLAPFLAHHADGGVFNQEHVATLNEGNKAEAVIPLEGNKQRGQSLVRYSAEKLGMLKGTGVEPNLSSKTQENLKSNAMNINVARDQAHIEELEKQTDVMVNQNQILVTMLNHMVQNGGNSSAQPVIMPVAQSNDELANQLAKMKSLGYNF